MVAMNCDQLMGLPNPPHLRHRNVETLQCQLKKIGIAMRKSGVKELRLRLRLVETPIEWSIPARGEMTL